MKRLQEFVYTVFLLATAALAFVLTLFMADIMWGGG